MTRRTMAALVALDLLWLTFLAFALADRRYHQRDPVFGVNQWGYRGEARAEREPGEIRVALVGGSAAYEAGLPNEATLASSLFFELRNAGSPSNQEYSVVNLAEPGVAADSYVDAIRRYAFLDPDVVVIFDGYDRFTGVPPHARERSLVFRSTGYLPILPARWLGRPGWLSDPDADVSEILRDGAGGDASCSGASSAYCAAMIDAVRTILDQGRRAIVVSPPSISPRHAQEQQSLAAALARAFDREPRFLYVDAGSAADLTKPVNSPDGVHRTNVGNHDIGQRVAQELLKMLGSSRPRLTARSGGSR